MQDHKPVVEQHEAVGHAVRAGYMYSAMTDIARFMDAPDYQRALDDLWSDVVGRKMYLTGNIGTGQYDDEGFGDPYLLPNGSAYCESCAAIAHVLWQHRMNLLEAQAKYADVMELALYNGVLSGISIAGDRFFYQNPLGQRARPTTKPWIGLSCCPTNLTRIIPQVGGLAYAVGQTAGVCQPVPCRRSFLEDRRRPDDQAGPADRLPLGRPRTADGYAGRALPTSRFACGFRAGPWAARFPATSTVLPAARFRHRAEINGQAADPARRPTATCICNVAGRPATSWNWTCPCRSSGSMPTRKSRKTRARWP